MTNRLRFPQETLEALPSAPSGKRAYYNDTRVPGLQLQVTDKGSKTFYVYRRLHNRPTRIKLGRFPDMKAAKARDQAKITIGQVAAGQNPKAFKSRETAERITLSDAFGEYVKVRSLKPKTVYDYERIIEAAFPDWKKKRLNRITKDRVGTRHRTLGERRAEAAHLKWETVNLESRTLTVPDTKNHEAYTLPLPDYLHRLLKDRKGRAEPEAHDADPPSRYVFPGKYPDAPLVEPRHFAGKIVKASGIAFTLHDLRRTFVTVAESLDISAYAIERLVNHKMRQDVTAGYIGTDVERLRKPMQHICDYLLKAGSIKEGKIISMSTGGPTRA